MVADILVGKDAQAYVTLQNPHHLHRLENGRVSFQINSIVDHVPHLHIQSRRNLVRKYDPIRSRLQHLSLYQCCLASLQDVRHVLFSQGQQIDPIVLTSHSFRYANSNGDERWKHSLHIGVGSDLSHDGWVQFSARKGLYDVDFRQIHIVGPRRLGEYGPGQCAHQVESGRHQADQTQ